MHPVFFGSARTGAGVDALMAGIAELLPPVAGAPTARSRAPSSRSSAARAARRSPTCACARARCGRATGSIGGDEAKVTAIEVFEDGTAVRRPAVAAGQIGTLWGLGDVRIGDAIGAAGGQRRRAHFAPPTLETVVVPRRAADRARCASH